MNSGMFSIVRREIDTRILSGVEAIYASDCVRQTFSVMKKRIPSRVLFYRPPSNTLHGVATKLEL